MYPISLGLDAAILRIKKLNENGHHAEALLTSVFTYEKTLKRSVRIAIFARGFSSRQADLLMKKGGLQSLIELWPIFDIEHMPFEQVIGQASYQLLKRASKMRNNLVHGSSVFKLDACKDLSLILLDQIRILQGLVLSRYGRDPWSKIQGKRTASLQWIS